jgi:hypothetical protein
MTSVVYNTKVASPRNLDLLPTSQIASTKMRFKSCRTYRKYGISIEYQGIVMNWHWRQRNL